MTAVLVSPDMRPLTWAYLKLLEPQLAALEQEARNVRPTIADMQVTHEGFKRVINNLLGPHARHLQLRTDAAFDLTLSQILKALERKKPRRRRQHKRQPGRRPLYVRDTKRGNRR